MKIVAVLVLLLIVAVVPSAGDTVRIATWNIEHLGSPGRGFGGGYGAGPLPLRTDGELGLIAALIASLDIDILCIQEAAVTEIIDGRRVSRELDIISDGLGPCWEYRIGSDSDGVPDYGTTGNMQNAILWNTASVRAQAVGDFPLPNVSIGGSYTFDRLPLVGYFETLGGERAGNDFVVVVVHLASGQDNDENHLVAMVMIERNLTSFLSELSVRESDRIILGDFNDNPYLTDTAGNPVYSDLMYRYMEWKGYTNLIGPDIGFTRMNDGLDSVIDHILVNGSAARHLAARSVMKHKPRDLAAWRTVYSDHLPLVFELAVSPDDDVD